MTVLGHWIEQGKCAISRSFIHHSMSTVNTGINIMFCKIPMSFQYEHQLIKGAGHELQMTGRREDVGHYYLMSAASPIDTVN